jgi:hypothetical protein
MKRIESGWLDVVVQASRLLFPRRALAPTPQIRDHFFRSARSNSGAIDFGGCTNALRQRSLWQSDGTPTVSTSSAIADFLGTLYREFGRSR